jgi:hypothetical protein
MKRLLLTCALALLSACASQAPLPEQLPTLTLPMQLHIQREQTDQHQDWLLVIQREDSHLRWSMLDLLGIPQARQVLDQGQWQADGFLPPNPAARELFAAVLFALTPAGELQQRYPQARQRSPSQRCCPCWRVDYRHADDFTLHLEQGLSYLVSPLPSETPP